jgi:hypothetical protein
MRLGGEYVQGSLVPSNFGGVLLIVCAAVSSAQTTAGLIGSITDASGAVIANARVTATNFWSANTVKRPDSSEGIGERVC